MLLARLSAPRPLGPDLEHWFLQDRSRISRFVKLAARHMYTTFHHTLCFDTERLQHKITEYSTAMAQRIGFTTPEEIADFNIGLIGDGTFFPFADPIDG